MSYFYDFAGECVDCGANLTIISIGFNAEGVMRMLGKCDVCQNDGEQEGFLDFMDIMQLCAERDKGEGNAPADA